MQSCRLGQEFRFSNGRSTSNLCEFLHILRQLPKHDFEHHVNAERNDFYNWVAYALNERPLAERLKPLRKKQEFVKVISEHLF